MSKNLNTREQFFYIKTTKKEMFLIIEQFSQLLKHDGQDWVEKAKEELKIIKDNGIDETYQNSKSG